MTLCVVGIGNRYRRDDGVGPGVVRLLAEAPDLRLMDVGDDPLALLDLCTDCEALVLVDAVVTGAAPGTVHRWDLSDTPSLNPAVRFSTHSLNPLEVLTLAQTLGRSLPRVILYGIEAGDVGPGEGLSPPVAAAARDVAIRIRQERSSLQPKEEEQCA